jgi:uncharacterized protein (TIGR02996 family)
MRRRAFLTLTQGTIEHPPSRKIALIGLMYLGSHRDNAIVLKDPDVLWRQAFVVETSRGWQIGHDFAGSPTLVNGEPIVRQLLEDGDVVRQGQAQFLFTIEQHDEAREPRLEDAICEQPDDDARWEVYADWLIEQGDALGERLRGLHSDPAPWLEGAARSVKDGTLALDWRHGCIRRVTAKPSGALPLDALALLLELPVARFVEAIVIDAPLYSEHGRDLQERSAQLVKHVEQVLGARPLPALRVLELTPLHNPAALSAPVRLPSTAPRLSDDGRNGRLTAFSTCWLEDEAGQRVELVPGADVQAEVLHSRFRFALWSGWRVSQLGNEELDDRPTLNGKPVYWNELLRPGDVLRAQGQRFTFRGA